MDEIHISRGLKSKRHEQPMKDRVPPGQYVTNEFPILSAGPTPQTNVANWNLAFQLGDSLLRVRSWAEFEALPQTLVKTDIHCVSCALATNLSFADLSEDIWSGTRDAMRPVYLLAGGTRITPLMSMLRRDLTIQPGSPAIAGAGIR